MPGVVKLVIQFKIRFLDLCKFFPMPFRHRRACLWLKAGIFLLLLSGFAPNLANAWENFVGHSFDAYVRRVQTGNLLEVSRKPGKTEATFAVAFYGIGIPTAKQPFGPEAHQFLVKLLPPGSKLSLTAVNENEDGIIFALVQHNDRSVSSRLIESGLAWVDRSSCKTMLCRRWHIQEHLAVRERKGIWSLNMTKTPWQWGE